MTDTAKNILRSIPPLIAIIFATYILTQVTSDRWCAFALGVLLGLTRVNFLLSGSLIAFITISHAIYIQQLILGWIPGWRPYPCQFLPYLHQFYESILFGAIGALLIPLVRAIVARLHVKKPIEDMSPDVPTRRMSYLSFIAAGFIMLSTTVGLYTMTHDAEDVLISRQFRSLNQKSFEQLKVIIEDENASKSSRITSILVLSGLGYPRDDSEKARDLLQSIVTNNEAEFVQAAKSSLRQLDYTQAYFEIFDHRSIPYYSVAAYQEFMFVFDFALITGRYKERWPNLMREAQEPFLGEEVNGE